MVLTVLIAIFSVIPILIWMYARYWENIFKTWKKRGIAEIPGTFPYGSNKAFTTQTEFEGDVLEKMYNQFPNDPYFGIYQGARPILVLRDPEIIRLVLAKEFSHFRDRSGQKLHPKDYLGQHLFNLEGEKWRALRVKMTPVFTSGKLKAMFPLFVKCAEALDNLLWSNSESTIDAKDITGRFNTDIICSCAFGLEVDSINDANNPFRVIGKKFMKLEFGFYAKLKVALMRYFPFIKSMTMAKITPEEVENFMVKVVKDTIDHRERTGKKRHDFIDLLVQIKDRGILNEDVTIEEILEKNIEPIELTFELMAAQCFVFFIAGFETSSSVQTFCLYEMAHHPEVQERLHIEIESVIGKHGGITYQALQEMEYLDMVVNETMRKYPTLTMLTRVCTIPLTTPHGHTLEKGDHILIPTWALHHDGEHFLNPEIFDPERFSPEKKAQIHQFAFLPFGEGPRMCIGERFGRLQTKMGIITILRRYIVSPCADTKPLILDKRSQVLTRIAEPIIVKLTKREVDFFI